MKKEIEIIAEVCPGNIKPQTVHHPIEIKTIKVQPSGLLILSPLTRNILPKRKKHLLLLKFRKVELKFYSLPCFKTLEIL